ncbi:putative signal transducing protein [Sunxiuqinia elliptica]|uniref:Putative signal transducing protein n=1 Tax=Sunxiuqinia elliptica TaxID=655355 RepID=A0A4R6GNE4_9BACT|nr:DUF2007 domain-containing protein [Sunxiuqinia elliptica]TDN96749.1 putative signal transducing protein [Sunxiuqinia elliptica]TDO55692.1 putative signal transducing protein [Sunxiuqinia elliptica]
MQNDTALIPVFTGSETEVILLKGQLEEQGISTLIRNDYQSGITAGFGGGTPSSIELLVQQKDLEAAQAILDDLNQ